MMQKASDRFVSDRARSFVKRLLEKPRADVTLRTVETGGKQADNGRHAHPLAAMESRAFTALHILSSDVAFLASLAG